VNIQELLEQSLKEGAWEEALPVGCVRLASEELVEVEDALDIEVEVLVDFILEGRLTLFKV